MQGHPVQGTDRVASGESRVGGRGIGERLIRAYRDEAVGGGLHLLGAGQRGPHHLDGGDLPGADHAREIGGGGEGEVGW